MNDDHRAAPPEFSPTRHQMKSELLIARFLPHTHQMFKQPQKMTKQIRICTKTQRGCEMFVTIWCSGVNILFILCVDLILEGREILPEDARWNCNMLFWNYRPLIFYFYTSAILKYFLEEVSRGKKNSSFQTSKHLMLVIYYWTLFIRSHIDMFLIFACSADLLCTVGWNNN